MADISTIVLPNKQKYNIKDSTARSVASDALPKSGGVMSDNASIEWDNITTSSRGGGAVV